MANSNKAVLSKCQATLLPPIYKASSDATPEIREATIACLAELVRKQSSAAFLEKVGLFPLQSMSILDCLREL